MHNTLRDKRKCPLHKWKEREKKCPGSVSLSESAPTVNGVYFETHPLSKFCGNPSQFPREVKTRECLTFELKEYLFID